MRSTCFPICFPIFFFLYPLIGAVRMFPASDIRGANAQWAGRLLRPFIASRIETPSGNIFPRANLIKARRTGLLNEQTVAAPQHAARMHRCGAAMAAKALAGGGTTQANAILCLSFSHFAPVVARCANPPRGSILRRRSLWSSGPFPAVVPRPPTGKWIPRRSELTAHEIYINIFDVILYSVFAILFAIALSCSSFSCCVIKRSRDAYSKKTKRYKRSERWVLLRR